MATQKQALPTHATPPSSQRPSPRLEGFGMLIDRDKLVAFSFEGRAYQGYEGDVIASALAAEGQWLLSRSFKYHRPRGVLTMAGQDANTLVQLPHEPNALADRHPISAGLEVMGQNYRGSLEKDDYAQLDRFGRFMPVGFYYRSFYKPQGAWKHWEPRIRKMAGLGTVNKETPHGYYDKAYGFFDVVVVGGGPAGMSAAIEAGKAGLDVLLLDEWPILGGSLTYARFDADGGVPRRLRRELLGEIEALPNVEVMIGAVCTGAFTDNWLPVLQANRLYKIRAQQIVLATGSFEQPMVFRNNDLPGVMLSSAAQRLMRLYGVAPGKRGVIATANDHGYELALDLLDAGIEIAALVDLRERPEPSEIQQTLAASGLRVERGKTVYEAIGKSHVEAVRLARVTGKGEVSAAGTPLTCDFVCMATGYSPASNLVWYAGGSLSYDDATAMHKIASLPEDMAAAGSLNGAYHLDAVIADGKRAGWDAAKTLGKADGKRPAVPIDDLAVQVTHPYPMFAHPKGRDFVDVDEDLQTKDIKNGIRDGYDDIQLLKRYSTLGMGPSQGRNSNVAGIRITASVTGKTPDEVGTTTSRPPFAPEKFAHLAGRSFEPVRETAMHHRHIEAGAQMMTAGLWMRPAYYGPKDQAAPLIAAEVDNCRQNIGLIDVSTLGGLDVRGPDAAEFINRIYTWAYLKQQVGRARYLLMCDETGVIIDDGVACRFHDNHYYLTATTSGVDAVYRQMLWWNAQWRLDVDIANVTAAYAGVNIAGPNSREMLSMLDSDIDLSGDAFPYMGVREGHIAGIPVRVLRVGFVGELGYEIHCPSSQGEALWDLLVKAGEPFALKPFGVEAQRVMRLEKGHIIVGQDTDGLTQPYEADMGWAIGKKKMFYVGKRAVEIQDANGTARKLVGFNLVNDRAPCPKECHLVIRDGEIVGRVTSAVHSPTLKKVIGLAYVAADQAEVDQRFQIKIEGGRLINAEVVPMPFYDPDNQRQGAASTGGGGTTAAEFKTVAVTDALMKLPQSTDAVRRSGFYRKLQEQGAVFGEVAGGALPIHYGQGMDEVAVAKKMGLAELSALPRLGFKGRAVLSQMNTEGVTLEFRPNRAFRQDDGTLAAVLAMTEVLLLSPLSGEAPKLAELASNWSIETADGGYPVPRQDSHFQFLVTGRHAAAAFAKICGVDLRAKSFPDLAIAQTSIAKSTAIVIRDDIGDTPAFHLLGDSASAGYMWDCLQDAMDEFGGKPVGLEALSALG